MPAPTTSFGAIDRVKSGDRDAFAVLFEKYARRLAVLLRYKAGAELRSAVEIDDLLQETFLRAFRDIEHFTYESPGAFWNWLAAIAGHVVTDAARFQTRQKRQAADMVRFRSETNPNGPEPADSMTPSRLFGEQEAMQSFFRRLDALPEDYRQVILLAKVEGLATAEIGERLGKSREAAALLLHRALKRFRALAENA